MTDFARTFATGRFPQQRRLQRVAGAPTKLDAQAQWEAVQTIPLLLTLVAAGAAAVLSQLNTGFSSTIWVAIFGFCALLAVRRVGRTYRQVFIAALMAEGVSADQAEAVYQTRYAD
jgi:hypothetical protein